MRVKRHHQGRFAARRAQRCQGELNLAPRIAGSGKFQRANAHGVQSLRVVEAQETCRHAAVGSKLRGHSGNVAAGALNATGREHIRE
jgi:hypothetical protein